MAHTFLITTLVSFLAHLGGSNGILFPPPQIETHKHVVAIAHFPLTDIIHKDPYAPNDDRKTMVSVFLPVLKELCIATCSTQYMPPQTAVIANEQFLGSRKAGVFEQLSINTCCASTTTIDAAKWPLVIIEPHTDTSRLLYSHLAALLSANGIVVLLQDHPHESSIVEYPFARSRAAATVYNSGTVPLSNFSPLTAWNETISTALSARTQDINFLLSQLSDPGLLQRQFPRFAFSSPLSNSSYGIIGHGLGGTLATLLGATDDSVRFSINLSGSAPLLPPTHANTTITTPTYFLTPTTQSRLRDPFWPTFWSLLTGRATEFDLADADTFDFADVPVALELARTQLKRVDVNARGVGKQDARAFEAVACFVEGIIALEWWGEGKGLRKCVREFGGMMPFMGRRLNVGQTNEDGNTESVYVENEKGGLLLGQPTRKGEAGRCGHAGFAGWIVGLVSAVWMAL